MCIQTRIQRILAEREALDARIAKLELLAEKTAPIKNLLTELLADYSQEAPEELAALWGEVLAIGQQHNLSVQPLAADELRQWETANAENVKLKAEIERLKGESDKWRGAVTIANLAVKNLTEKVQLSKVPQNITERALKLDKFCTQCVESDNFAGFIQEIQHIVKGNEGPSLVGNEYDNCFGDDNQAVSNSIPALTLWQPWASLIQYEVKRVETRSWGTNYRGPIAIHAAKKIVATSISEINGLTWDDLFELLPADCEFPLGAVVAIANLIDCVEMTPEFIAQQSEQELKCGDWQPGRFAWVLEIIRPVVPPTPATGGQKLWNWSGTSIAAELEYLEKWNAKPEYEPESAIDSIDRMEDLEVPGRQVLPLKLPEGAANTEEVLTGTEYDAAVEKELALDGEDIPELGGDWEIDIEAKPEESTKLQKLLEGNNNFTFENLGVSVAVESVMIEQEIEIDGSEDEDDDAPAIEKIEEARFTVTNAEGQMWEYYHGAEQLVKGCQHLTTCIVFKAEQYAKKFLQDLGKDAEITDKTLISNQAISEPIAQSADTNRYCNFNQIFELQDFKVDVKQHNKSNEFAGASFNFYKIREDGPVICQDNLTYSKSLTATECTDKHPKELATEILESYWQKIRETKEKEANPYKKPEDDFVELVMISPCVGYLKQIAGTDVGKILSGYAAFSSKDADGEKITFARPRATKWAEYLRANNEASEEGKNSRLVIEDPRKSKRLVSDNPKQVFTHEIKLTGVDLEYLGRLAQLDLSVPPNEQRTKKTSTEKLSVETAPNFKVKINSYEVANGSEEKMKLRIDEELKTFGTEERKEMRLVCGNEVIERYSVVDFNFIEAQDFDAENPEYWVLHRPTQTNFRVYRSLASGTNWVNSIYPHNPLRTKEAAAVDAVRRQLKAEKAE